MRNGSNAMPVRSTILSPAFRTGVAISSGVRNWFQLWVPRGSQRSTYSAPTIASAKLLAVRLSVDSTKSPPGRTSEQAVARKASGSGTCSTTSRASTTSKRSPAADSVSAVAAR